MFFNFSLSCFSQTEFITTWRTTTANESIEIPTTGGGYSYNVNWGDGSIDTTTYTGNASHIYTTAGTYTVTISGNFRRIFFDGSTSGTAPNRDKILSIEQWGSGRVWTSMFKAFEGCSNLVNNALDIPDLSSATSLGRMFRDATSIGDVTETGNWNWDTSNINSMNSLFNGATSFNKDISGWDTSSVTSMGAMFKDAIAFNQNIGGWVTTSVTQMNSMFAGATIFNQNINGWDVSSVTTMSTMFRDAVAFNQNLNSWTTTSLTVISNMFRDATSFNGNVNSWNVSGVTTMANTFYGATSFNQDLNSWTPTSASNMANMFREASSFNGNISSWNVSSVTNMSSMFRDATIFNNNISSWTPIMVTSMAAMFRNADAFNQDIGGWNVSSVTNMGAMFRNVDSFDQNIGVWDVSNVTNFGNMFNGSKLSTKNYNALLIGWNAQSLQPNENFHAGTSTYCSPAAIAARANMIASDGWNFNGADTQVTTFVWNGNSNTDFNTQSNWQDGFDDTCVIDISIPVTSNDPIIDTSTSVPSNNLTIDSGATLTINGALTVNTNLTTNNGLTLNSGSSIIVNGTSTGNLTYKRNLPNGFVYYNTASPVLGETVENFIATNNPRLGSSGNVGLYYYNNNGGGFAGTGYIFYTPTSTGTINSGQGYGVQLASGSDISFTGTMPVVDASITIGTGSLDNFALVGNPFPSYLPINDNAVTTNNILTNNTALLSEETAWFWDNTINDYVAINNGSPARYLAPAQGFFVEAASSGSFNFLESWQEHQATDVFNKSTDATFRVYLTLKNNRQEKKLTEIYFIANKTINFDNGYDSSSFSDENANFYLASKLVNTKEDKNLTIQTLPLKNIENTSIPLVVNGQGNLSFSIDFTNKPNDISIFIEDRLLNIFKELNYNQNYTVNVGEFTKGANRFYLHTQNRTLSVLKDEIQKINIYKSDNKNLIIKGLSVSKTTFSLFDILGKQLRKEVFTPQNPNKEVSLLGLKKGIYIANLKTERGSISKKIIID
ncbi:BspA family leucine-rich repeat surface protein [uncultured Polaribacter sp.]|uniref:BspA family leucine-rich repeat surface protein n=1 Tax=uncultured Polaribacter sp. TaxID=174711 RepID=UPI0026045F29|nr:BspA family leucine-rich repeat surface protein [uncultured Polaribacter sp.]